MTEDSEIYIGFFPPEGTDWRAMLAAITGYPHYDSDAPYIDSRLNAVHCRTENETGNIVGNRRHLWVKNKKSFATLLYRLDELYSFPPSLPDRVIERGEMWFQDMLSNYLGLNEETDYLLQDVPIILACPECGEKPPDLELQDMVYVCHECGWQADYSTEWPYLCYFSYPDWVNLGRLDIFVSRHLVTEETVNE